MWCFPALQSECPETGPQLSSLVTTASLEFKICEMLCAWRTWQLWKYPCPIRVMRRRDLAAFCPSWGSSLQYSPGMLHSSCLEHSTPLPTPLHSPLACSALVVWRKEAVSPCCGCAESHLQGVCPRGCLVCFFLALVHLNTGP